MLARMFSPYDLNPGGANPLRDILQESIDFERLAASPINLFITLSLGALLIDLGALGGRVYPFLSRRAAISRVTSATPPSLI